MTCLPRINGKSQGFTLLELLVAMMIISMVTMIMAFSLKLFIGAWERGKSEGDTFQARISVPVLMRKQLLSIVRERSFITEKKKEALFFEGSAHSISFFSTHTLEVFSNKGGLYRLTFVYDDSAGRLDIYRQLITSLVDLSDEFNPLSDEWDREDLPVGTVNDIKQFSLSYANGPLVQPLSTGNWDDRWEKKKPGVPAGVYLKLDLSEDTIPPEEWYFPVGSGK